jgi:stearoyl-CoA desaturase (delta-9 desaturase)
MTVSKTPQTVAQESPESPAPNRLAEQATDPSQIQPTHNETLDRTLTGIVTVAPVVGIFFAAWHAWQGWLGYSDLIVFAILYVGSGLGVTVGFHRLFTHRSFQTYAPIRAIFAILGSMAIEGPVISWVADHRRHHKFSDLPGDPHSPHAHDHGHGWKGALMGFVHAHVGWIFIHTNRGSHEHYAPDLLEDRVVSRVHKTFLVWALGGLAMAFGLGVAIGGSLMAGLTGLLWGGAVRLFMLHHATFAVNSVCHVFGRKPFDTGDESRNVGWLALPTFGEAWHNNHHAFPTSAAHGLKPWQIDISAGVIWLLEKTGLAWDVKRPGLERQQAKLASSAA